MYIILIGWLYVTLLIAVAQGNVVAGSVSFLFYGLLPCALLFWLTGGSRRRRAKLLADQRLRENDGADAETDQKNLL